MFPLLDPAMFDDKARNYSEFQQDFKSIIEEAFDEWAQIMYLQKAFPKQVKNKLLMQTRPNIHDSLPSM